MTNYFEILCGMAALLLALYYYATLTFNFWKNRGVIGPQPLPFLGNTNELMFARKSIPHYLMEIYDTYKNEPMVGLYMRRSPLLIVQDPEFIKDILIRDFPKFADRGFHVYERVSEIISSIFRNKSM